MISYELSGCVSPTGLMMPTGGSFGPSRSIVCGGGFSLNLTSLGTYPFGWGCSTFLLILIVRASLSLCLLWGFFCLLLPENLLSLHTVLAAAFSSRSFNPCSANPVCAMIAGSRAREREETNAGNGGELTSLITGENKHYATIWQSSTGFEGPSASWLQ